MNPRDLSDDELAPLLRIGLEDDADGPPPAGEPQSWEPPSVEELQRALPQYEISHFIARGGMGAVYRGRQKALRRSVAIKVLPPGIDDGDRQFAARFQQEAQTLAQLTHPNIVAIHEAGETTDGLLYLVMEFIEGTDVARLIASEGLVEPRRAIQITCAVCEALAFAHGEGIIHRDIKPSNILLDTKGHVKVADFGLAKTALRDRALHTGTDVAMGTPDFVAPEALIAGTKVDQRADIYAVGVMLYQMLTGHLPRGRFASPSSVAPQVDKRLDAVVDKALQPDREQRYGTATEMKTDVDAARTPREKAERKMSRTRIAAIVAAGLVLASAAGFFLWGKGNPSRAARAAESSSTFQSRGEAPSSTAGLDFGKSSYTKDAPFVNTLGMKFVPVPILGGPTGGQRVLFSVWDTRVQDYEVFARETKREWRVADFPQEPTHPAVHVSWEDAQLFCQWLTAREHAAGRLGAQERYRLPSDHEWSCAVEIGAREDEAGLPSEKDGQIAGVYPWGKEWPPPKGAGNYGGEELQPDLAAGKYTSPDKILAGHNDGFVNTSPVGSFAANRFGLYDLGGNVRQWCEDWFDAEQKERVLRGASWRGSVHSNLLSSARRSGPPTRGGHYNGFRCVVASGAAARSGAPAR